MDNISKLEKLSKEITNLGAAEGLLGWDQEVMMPEKGIEARKQQKSVLAGIRHDKITSEELGSLLDEIDETELSEEDFAIYREIKRSHDKSCKVPKELEEKISEKGSETVKIWQTAKEEDDFELVRPHLEELLELKREYARHIDPDSEPYQVLFEDFEPYMPFEDVKEAMKTLREDLPEIYSEAQKDQENVFAEKISEENQKKINKSAVETLGFDFERGRFDVSSHPFTAGNQFDTRITTNYSEDNLLESLMATIHETGHALYQQGLPQEHYGTPLGTARDLSIHESQSRLWENHVGRSKAFWNFFSEKLENEIGFEASPEECYNSANKVDEENLIRIYSDEISYHLHIALRFELGRALINGDLEISELPKVWNQKMEEYLGVSPETDAEGCMQDIHWFQGGFGYFPTYSLGSILAAQIYNKAESEIEDLESEIESGNFKDLRGWLRKNIHSKGCLKRTDNMIDELVGGLDPEEFTDYLERKYLEK